MNRVDLISKEHPYKMGNTCPLTEPNIIEDTEFYEDGIKVGFFLKKMPQRMIDLAEMANTEFRSPRVPKSLLNRGTKKLNALAGIRTVQQYSTILGSIGEKPHMRRNYKTRSSVHSKPTAKNFIKAMLLLAMESEKLVKEHMPEQYKKQQELFKNVPEKWKFGTMFTSTISNYNIPAAYHMDRSNLKETVNVIICKQYNATGGNLNLPEYGATIGQGDNSVLVYPAWRNMHGVTPIKQYTEDGYRNSHIFYPLKAFYAESK